MKLRNLMYATMIACAFASCSKDEVIDNGPDPVAKGDASLTIKIDTKGTKAAGDDATIKELAVFLYKVTGETKTLAGQQYVGIGSYNEDGQIVFEDLTVGDTYMCVGFANLGSVSKEQAAGTSPLGLTIAEGLYAADGIPMHGVSANVEISATENVATIKLTRDLAKVELTAVTLNMNYLNEDGSRFGDYTKGTAKFTFNSASINAAVQAGSYTYSNAGTYTYFMAENPVYVGGLTGWSWNKGEGTSYSNAVVLSGYEISGSNLAEATQTIGTPAAGASDDDKKAYAAQPVAKPAVVFYVLPNPEANNTTLTLKGTMQLINASTESQSNINNTVTGYYNIRVGEGATVNEGSGFSYDGTGVHANDYFKIQAIVVGTGSGLGGDKPKLIVKTTVNAWNEISQVTPVK